MSNALDRLAARLGYCRREYPRSNNGADAIARGERWQAFYAEHGGLQDMISSLRRDYFEKFSALKPGDTDAMFALAVADKVAREIDAKVRSIVETGKLRRHDAEHAEKIAKTRR